MAYAQKHLLDWLNNHPCISIECLEGMAESPQNTLRHFLKERRNLPDKHFKNIVSVLLNYGYIPLKSE